MARLLEIVMSSCLEMHRFLNNKNSDLNILKKNDEQATRLILRLPFINNTLLHFKKELKLLFVTIVRKIELK